MLACLWLLLSGLGGWGVYWLAQQAGIADLRASGEQFAEQLTAAGVPVQASTAPGALHGYLNAPDASAEAAASAQRTIDTYVDALRGLTAPAAPAAPET